ncbi:MAG: hypothetical protein K6C06_06600 [Lachnospiraceae bacterium]|nr:hypothetical protein [Lachnospiraceae bacterium]
MNESILQKRILSAMNLLSKLHAVVLLSLPAPVLCLLDSGRSDIFVCRMYLAGGILIICSLAADFAARRMRSFGGYLACCLPAAFVMLCGAYALGTKLLSPGLRSGLLAELVIDAFILITSAARLRMREKLRQKAREENDISWVDRPVLLEAPSIFGLLWLIAAYLFSMLTSCPAFCDLMLLSCVLYSLILLVYTCLQSILSYYLEIGQLTNVPFGKIFRQSALFLSLLTALLLLCIIPASLTKGLRPYRDIRGMTADWIMQPEEMASSETDPFNSTIIPEELRELGENHPTPVLLIYLGWLLTGAVLLLTFILTIRLVLEYIHQFKGKAPEENGDIAVSLEEDAAVRVRRFVSSRRAGRNLTDREKIRQEYRRAIRKYRRGKNLPAACETPTQIEEGTAFPDDYDVERLHEAYAQARYGKPAQNSSS